MTDYSKEFTYAQMANQAYKDQPVAPAGWQVVPNSTVNDKNTGFAATAFQNPVTKEIVIAYRGTDNLDPRKAGNDIAADSALANPSPAWNIQFKQGLDYAKKIMDTHPEAAGKISVTGHSLGGGLAQISSQMYGLPGITFDPAAAKNVVQSQQFKEWALAHQLPAQGIKVPQDFNNYLVNKSVASHLTGEHVRANADIPVSGIAGRSWFSQVAGEVPFVSQSGLVGATVYGASKGYDQLQRHSMDRIEKVFEEAARTGKLNQIGHNTLTSEQTKLALHDLHDKVGQGLPAQSNLSQDQHLNLTMYTAQKMAKDGIAMHEMGDIRYQEFNGKQLLVVQNTQESKFTTADINKAIAVPAEQTLAAMNQPAQVQEHSQRRSMHI